MKTTKWNAKMLAVAAVSVAMSYLLSFIVLYHMPSGGSITAVSMLPVMLFAWLYGVRPGMLAGMAYGLLDLILKPEIVHWAQAILDYPLAFAMLGLAGAFRSRKQPYALPLGIVLAGFFRFLCHLISGMAFFAEYAPASDFLSVFLYSAGYNGGYMSVETVSCAVLAALPAVRSMLRRIEKL